MKQLVFACAVLSSVTLFAGVYDDVIWWFNKPYDTGSMPGVLETGEMLDALRGGIPSADQHKGIVYGYDESRSNVTMTVKTAYFEKDLPVALFTDVVKDSLKFPGNVNIATPLNVLRPTTVTEFSSVVRFKWDGNSHSTAWLYAANNGSLNVGVVNGKIRVWPGDAVGGSSGISSLPVTANKWYDLGVSVVKGGGADDKNLLMIVLVGDDGTKCSYVDDTYSGFPDPSKSTTFNFATESLKKSASSSHTKYFTGAIQQMVFWNRALSEDEFLEAFAYSNGDKSLVGVANGNGNEFGGTGTDIVMDGDWKDVPKTLAAGGTYTVKFAGAVDSARLLKVKGTSGATTLKVDAVSAPIAGGGEAAFFVPRSAMSEEDDIVSFALQNSGDTDLVLDCLSLTDNAIFTNHVEYTSDVTESIEVPQDTALAINVPEGASVRLRGVISGDGRIVKKGLGTLEPTAANTLKGGFFVQEGVLRAAQGGVFGTGAVTVHQNGTGICQAAVAGTIDNNFVFTGSSTEAFPGLHFADVTTLNGTVDAMEDLWMTTAWNDTIRYADTVQVTLKGQVTVAGTLALAPHCRVSFSKTISCDTLDLRWAPNSATADGGNPGAVCLASCGDKTSVSGIACPMRRVLIDQTRIIQNGNNVFGGRDTSPYGIAEVEWTGLHKTGGSIHMNGAKLEFGKVITPPTTPDDMTSMTIIQSNSSYLNFYDTPTSTLYLRLSGSMPASFNTSGSTITLANRRHELTGRLVVSASDVILTGGTAFLKPTTLDINSNGRTLTCKDMTDPDALRKVDSFATGTSRYGNFSFDQSAFDTIRQDYSVTVVSGTGGTSYFTLPSADSIWRVKAFTDRDNVKAPGRYANGDLNSSLTPAGAQIWVAVTDDAEPSGTLAWDAADEVWKDGDGQTVTDVSFARYETATCAFSGADGAATATLPDTLFVKDLDLATTGGGVKTLAGAAGSRVQVKGELTLSDGAEYVFKPKMELAQAKTFNLGERSIAFDGGLSVTGGGTNVIESGTVSVGTALDGAILVKGGATLALKGAVTSSDVDPIIMETESANSAPRLLLDGVTLDKPVKLGTRSAQGVFLIDATGDKAVTNVFAGRMTDVGSTAVYFRKGYTYEFLNAAFAGKHEFDNLGRETDEETTVICRGTITQGLRKDGGYLNVRDSIRLVLDCAGLESRVIYAVDAKSVVDFRRSFVFAERYLTTADALLLDGGSGTFLLNTTYQKCSALQGTAASRICGEAGSAIEICLGNDTTYPGAFEGAASLVMNGTGKQGLTGVSTSTGALIVRQGTLELGATASWANASQVVLEGGTLSVLNRRAFGFDTTELILAGGKISGRAKFGSGKVKTADGTVLEDGVYGSESGWVAEGGKVIIGTTGMMISIR